MSDSVRPHRRQPTRLPRPWDSPGKNTGVGRHFLLQCMKVKSESEVKLKYSLSHISRSPEVVRAPNLNDSLSSAFLKMLDISTSWKDGFWLISQARKCPEETVDLFQCALRNKETFHRSLPGATSNVSIATIGL